MNSGEYLPAIVTASVALVTALVTITITQINNKKQLRIQAVSMQRVDWLAQVRELLSSFGIAYRRGEHENLEDIRFRILLYLREDKPHYDLLTEILGICCTYEYSEEANHALILISQRELSRAWERLNTEASLSMFREPDYEIILNTVDSRTFRFLKLLNDDTRLKSERFANLNAIIDRNIESANQKQFPRKKTTARSPKEKA